MPEKQAADAYSLDDGWVHWDLTIVPLTLVSGWFVTGSPGASDEIRRGR